MIINDELIRPIIEKSKTAQRKRQNYNFHNEASDPLHRMLNVLQPESYVHPHKHENPDKREAFILISGKLLVILFDNNGKIDQHLILDRTTHTYGIEIQPGVYHTIMALEADTVIYEVKDGPYNSDDDKQFASWAPREEDKMDANKYLKQLIKETIL
ncbi:WbuC family cupin fold metalloprotein [Carboxylicivirga sp. N1Y90]|uniref:WbuC family cupin fold metalloprotein n=1 Tax=Carboxylicivirga fragile TaxID=3417571 RepID=UPI003D3441B7|nr:WbuC family cupin fold metalloprotein [Marinilabiliaceae bacterium N1Y90]